MTAFLVQSSLPSALAQGVPAEAAALGFEPTTPPTPVPGFEFSDETGNVLTIADFRGRVVLLNLWATWCAPCIREMPSLDRLQAALGGSRFEVVALSVDRQGAPQVAKFFTKLDLKYLRRYYDPKSRSLLALAVPGLPTTLLIDAEGRELGRVIGPAEWDSEAWKSFISRYIDGSPTTAASVE